jgi:hypothetical protein
MATRVRRGKVVEIPEQWVGKFPTKKTMRERPSKKIGKLKRRIKGGMRGYYKDQKDQPIGD